jgi:methylated-DNA-[protein]-cysteine S-methyltransferase
MPFVIQWLGSCTGTEEISKIDTPAGTLVIYSQSGVIISSDWEMDESPIQACEYGLKQQLDRYWLNLDKPIHIKLLKQGTPFRNRVWAELCKIPFGETISYSTLAGKIGSAARAVGNACRDNPYPLLIPCHRVVSKTGMGGYNGQTKGDFMAIKRKLLDFEAAYRQ